MKSSDLILRCYAKRDKGEGWYAVCLDLNLVAYGDDLKEVHDKLHSMIYEYVLEALTEDRKYVADLLDRPAPFYFYLRYYLIKVLNKIKKATDFKIYDDNLPVIPQHGC
jgi:hypothetical protein